MSEARLRANRDNAQQSTGPKTDKGKEKSRLNALTHGLRAEHPEVLSEVEAAEVARREGEWEGVVTIRNEWDRWNLRQMIVAAVKIERCQEEEWTARTHEAQRAAHCWELDRAAEIEQRAARLAEAPSRVVADLKRSKAGCDWLIERWELLLKALRIQGLWDEPHRRLASDLLGIPPEFRTVDPAGLASSPPETLTALVESQLGALRNRRETALDALDDDLRELAAQGCNVHESHDLRRIRRYEAAHWRRLERAARRLGLTGTRMPKKAAESAPTAEPAPAPRSRWAIPTVDELKALATAPPQPSAPPLVPSRVVTAPAPTRSVSSSASTFVPRNRKERRELQRQLARQAKRGVPVLT